MNRQALGRNKLLYVEGSLDPKNYTNSSFDMVPIHGNNKPVIQQGQVLAGIEQEIAAAQARFDDMSGRTQVLQGKNPAQVRSAFQLDILDENAQVPFADRVRQREVSAQNVFWLAASMTRRRDTPENITAIYGPDRESEVIAFLNCDFRTDLVVTEGSALPLNKASQEAKVVELLRYGMFTDDETGKIEQDVVLDQLRMGKVMPLVSTRRMVRQVAKNENYKMLSGQMVMPSAFEDQITHAEVHSAFMESREFHDQPEQIQTILAFHVSEHQRLIMEGQSADGAMSVMQQDATMQKQIQAGNSLVESGLPGLG